MRKLTLKWKFFLIVNYFLLAILLFCILGAAINIATIKNTQVEYIVMISLLFFFILIGLISVLNIFITGRFFPDNPLSPKIRKMLNIGRAIMIVFTLGMGIMFFTGIIAITEKHERRDNLDGPVLIFFAILFISSLFITILQFQIPRHLNQQSAGTINQLIDSIGK